MSRPVYPFAAIVGQEDMKLGLILTAMVPELSGILIRGEKGTAKSTAVRGLAALLPDRAEVGGNPYHLSLDEYAEYHEILGLPSDAAPVHSTKTPVVELPVGATEDRLVGTLDLETALTQGKRQFQPGLLAAAHRGILYVDEVNLLDDHLVDLLLDSAAMGVNTVEREGISVGHPSRFCLVGTMNPEEGELRPQLLDRFGLCVTVKGENDPVQRVEVITRRSDYEKDPEEFACRWESESSALGARIREANGLLSQVKASPEILFKIAQICISAQVDGHRADIMMERAARGLAAWEGRTEVVETDLAAAARFVLPHRMRRAPLQQVGEVNQVE